MFGRKKAFTIFILGLLAAIGPFSIDMYLPGFPAIASELATDPAHVSLSLSSFFIGISFGQLLYGPLLDRFGRKRPLYLGLLIYVAASLACGFSQSINTLIGMRLLQALGGCAGMVASRALVRDIFPIEENAKVFSMLMLVIGVSPIIAPTVGGYISSELSWRYVFYVLAAFGAVILAAIHFGLPEGRQPDSSLSLRPRPIIAGFLTVTKEPQFYTYAFTGSVGAAGLYAYISGSPHLFMEVFGVSEKQYGWIFAIIAAGLILSSQINSLLLRKSSSEKIIVVALLIQCITGLTIMAGVYLQMVNLYSVVVLIFVFLCCQGFIFPNTSALAMAPFTRNAGSASALMGAIQMGIGALASALVSIFTTDDAFPMAAVMALCAIVGFIILLFGQRVIKYKASILEVEKGTASFITKT